MFESAILHLESARSLCAREISCVRVSVQSIVKIDLSGPSATFFGDDMVENYVPGNYHCAGGARETLTEDSSHH